MIIPSHSGYGMDGSVMKICAHINTEKIVVPVSRVENFVFNTELLQYKEAVIIDYIEYSWDWDLTKSGTHFFGKNTKLFPIFKGNDEWRKFDDWVGGLEKVTYLKRELLKRDVAPGIHPIDYPCWVIPPEPDTEEQFYNRPINAFFFWGRSHEARVQLHGNIWRGASEYGYSVCDNIHYIQAFLDEEKGDKWVTLNIPHYKRVDISTILTINGMSKISIAMPGAGMKTFRGTGESPTNSVVFMKEDELAYSYPWDDFVNCLKFRTHGSELANIQFALNGFDDGQLYQIYLNGVQNCRKYQIENYVKDYLLPIING